jgi:hypothetical protein
LPFQGSKVRTNRILRNAEPHGEFGHSADTALQKVHEIRPAAAKPRLGSLGPRRRDLLHLGKIAEKLLFYKYIFL